VKQEEYLALEERYGAHNYKPLDVVIARGRGVNVWDVDGRQYIDCLAAYSAVNQGHCHPRILQAMLKQAETLTLTSRAFRNDQLGPFYRELCKMTNSHKVLPMNSGAEAVETAIKTVRKWGYTVKGVPDNEAEIIVCDNNFHGRTISIVSFSTDNNAREGFGPFTPGFKIVPYGDAAAIEAAISERTVAVLVEPIQGEAGVIIPPTGFLRQLRDICDHHDVVMILDEIQTGLGRTGTLLAEEHEGIEADLTIIGKALSGGFYPVSAVLSNSEVMSVLQPGVHGSTFGGNPLACAIARTALQVLLEEDMISNSRDQGAYFLQQLRQLAHPAVKEVRGRGLMLAMEFYPDAGNAREFCYKLKDLGVLAKDTHETTVRYAPPLLITRSQVDQIVAAIAEALKTF
jgi:ornithine--oxo-acid transaminase